MGERALQSAENRSVLWMIKQLKHTNMFKHLKKQITNLNKCFFFLAMMEFNEVYLLDFFA